MTPTERLLNEIGDDGARGMRQSCKEAEHPEEMVGLGRKQKRSDAAAAASPPQGQLFAEGALPRNARLSRFSTVPSYFSSVLLFAFSLEQHCLDFRLRLEPNGNGSRVSSHLVSQLTKRVRMQACPERELDLTTRATVCTI